MESTGPTTRSRAQQGAPLQTSAAPNTRRKPATRSTRKSSVPLADSVPAKEASAAKENDAIVAHSFNDETASSSAETGVPPTIAAPDTAPIPGLTPINPTTAAGYSMATPATMGPSPVMPIKLDSLWSPEVPQPSVELAAPATAAAPGRPSAVAGVDLAAMFISTPAPPTVAAEAGASPIEGVVSTDPSATAVAADGDAVPFAEQPFGGFAEAAAVGSPAAAAVEQNQQGAEHQAEAENDSGVEQASFGSPAAVAMEDATVTEMDEAPAPPMSLSHQPTPVASNPALVARSSSTPAAAAAAAPVHSTPGRTPARASKSPAPAGTPASPWPESDDDMPEPEDEYPEEKALLAEALADSLKISSATPQDEQAAAATEASDMHADASAAEQVETAVDHLAGADVAAAVPEVEHQGTDSAYEQQEDAAEPEQYSEEDLLHDLPTTDDADDLMDADLAAATKLDAEPATADGEAAAVGDDDEELAELTAEPPAAMGLQQDDAVKSAAAELEDQVEVVGDTAAAECDMQAEAAEGQQDTAMDSCGNPAAAAAGPVAGEVDTTPAKEPAASADAAVSPAGRMTGTSATTAAAPKSALTKPKDPTAAADPKATARKSAHVMLPDPSPVKSTFKPGLPGSSNDSSSSPGHTPFPTKSKVRAATSAADRAAAAAKEVSLKKEIAYARAHSALKHYSTSSKAEQQIEDSPDSASAAAAAAPGSAGKKSSSGGGGKSVTSRLLQPTASSMAKSRSSLSAEIDPYVWSPPEAEPPAAAAAAAAGPSKPRLASKVVVPSPPAKAAEPSLKAIKRAIKEKTEKRAKATLAEERSTADTEKVQDVNATRGSQKSSKAKAAAPPAAAAELEFDDEDYEEGYDQDYNAAAGDLADSMAGLSMGPIRVHKPEGPLKGVAAPAGKHFVFDDEGNAKQTPASKLRAAPKHTYFDDEGNPKTSPVLPRWR